MPALAHLRETRIATTPPDTVSQGGCVPVAPIRQLWRRCRRHSGGRCKAPDDFFDGGGDCEDGFVFKVWADDLYADWQALIGEPDREGSGG